MSWPIENRVQVGAAQNVSQATLEAITAYTDQLSQYSTVRMQAQCDAILANMRRAAEAREEQFKALNNRVSLIEDKVKEAEEQYQASMYTEQAEKEAVSREDHIQQAAVAALIQSVSNLQEEFKTIN